MSNRIDKIKQISTQLPKTDINTVYLVDNKIIHKHNHEKALKDMDNFLTPTLSLKAAALVKLSLNK